MKEKKSTHSTHPGLKPGVCSGLILSDFSLPRPERRSLEAAEVSKYRLSSQGEFVIENYNFSKPFANFFPGIAGKYGIPMWVFYVNRGQAICSLGTKDKDHAIVEFFPANRAWQMVSSLGFRTLLKVFSAKRAIFYEPFHNGFANLNYNLSNKMRITSYGLTLEEDNLSLGLRIKVEYFNIPNESYAGLARVVSIKNLNRTTKSIQLIDGLPQLVPYGTSNLFLKKLGRTIEAWMGVENLDKGVPFYKLNVDPTDRPEVIHIKAGNFYLGFYYDKGKPSIIKPIVDPQSIFGSVTDFSYPYSFLATDYFPYPKKQIITSKTPSAFLLHSCRLTAFDEKTIYSLIGNMRSQEMLNSSLKRITAWGYFLGKQEENKKIIEEIQNDIATKSESEKFNLYAKQTYLDNILRGGYPQIFKSNQSQSVFYLYSRKHGDLERDYNKFQLQATYFSQGNGNYRDINQNRRSDLWFNPEVKEENLVYFFNLLQADGFNPLVVKGASFEIKTEVDLDLILKGLADEKEIPKITSFLKKPFTPGELILFIEDNKIKLKKDYDALLEVVLSHCRKHQEAEHGEGFWTDHWSYNLDLLENYLAVYPEKLNEILCENRSFTYYDNTEVVRPRHDKYLLYHGLPRQLRSVITDIEKKELIRKRSSLPHVVRTKNGQGEIYQTNLINKLLCLVVNKVSSLDPFGMGIEMEANKPNWYDALNGLPALFGSSLCETFELKRLILFIRKAMEKSEIKKILLAEEIYDFLNSLGKLIRERADNNSLDKDFQFWDKSHSVKEEYLRNVKLGFTGNETEINSTFLFNFLDSALNLINSGLDKALDKKKNIYYGYFINEVREYKPLNETFIKPTKFAQKKLPFFLEAQVHALRLSKDYSQAKALYKATRRSQLYDRKLKMYKVTASLMNQPEEIGRCRAFAPGWLENESIWLHMEYKYLLEILKQGLYEEFYEEFKNVLIPFQRPERYGRSILENSSFLVSSVFADKNLHGNGFVARLSGSTAEFLQIWTIMNMGREPFSLSKNQALNLRFSPILPGWLFAKKDKTYAFNFLGKIKVTYHNPKRKDTFGRQAVVPKRISFLDTLGKPIKINSDTIPSPFAEQIRERQIKQIDIYLE